MIDEGVAPPLRDYVDVLWRRKKAIIGITAIVVGLSLWYASQKTPIYHSSAEVLVRPIRLSPTDTSTTFVDINTEQQVAQSSAVIDLAKNDLGASQIGSLSVKNILNTNTLQFTSSSTNARVAQRSADAYANAYLEFRRQGVVDDLQAASQPMNQRIQQLAQQINGVQAELARTKDPTQVTSLQIQLTSLLTQKTTLEGQLNNLILPEELRVGTVLQAAILPTRPSSLGLARVGILGLLMGLALGTGLALMRERLDDRVRDREHLEALAGAPVLAVVPRLRSWRRNGVGLSILTKPDSEIAEAYKSLRTSFMFAASQRGAKTVMVTSCNPDEGKTTTIANLGLALARGGKHVALVSGDLRRPQLDRYLSVRAEAGLTRVLTGECDLLDAMVWADENLWFIGAGPPPGNPADLLGSEQMAKVLRQLEEIAEFVLIDSAAMLAVADTIALAPLVDAVLLLVDAERTRPKAIAEATYQLDHVGARLLGAVLNKYDPSQINIYQHYGRYRTQHSEPMGSSSMPGEVRRRS